MGKERLARPVFPFVSQIFSSRKIGNLPFSELWNFPERFVLHYKAVTNCIQQNSEPQLIHLHRNLLSYYHPRAHLELWVEKFRHIPKCIHTGYSNRVVERHDGSLAMLAAEMPSKFVHPSEWSGVSQSTISRELKHLDMRTN